MNKYLNHKETMMGSQWGNRGQSAQRDGTVKIGLPEETSHETTLPYQASTPPQTGRHMNPYELFNMD